MIKDILKSVIEITDDSNLNPTEKVLLLKLVANYNVSMGYAFPGIDVIMACINTNRPDTAYKYIKLLKDKGYITVGKGKSNNNLYYVHKHLYIVNEPSQEQAQPITPIAKPVDSNGNKPLENQVHIDEVLPKEDSNVIELSDYTGFNKKQVSQLLAVSKDDKAVVIQAFEYMKKQATVTNEFKYTLWVINNADKTIKVKIPNPYIKKEKAPLRFNNFEPREYDYEDLEKRLLGEKEAEPTEAEQGETNTEIAELLKSM